METAFSRTAAGALLTVLAVALLSSAQAWADSRVDVRPSGTAKQGHLGGVAKAINDKVAGIDELVQTDVEVGPDRVIDPTYYLAWAGRDDGVAKFVGVDLSKSGRGFVLLSIAADAATGTELARHEIPDIKRKNLAQTAGQGMLDFLAMLSATPTEALVEKAPVDKVLTGKVPMVSVEASAAAARGATPAVLETDGAETGNALGLAISLGQPTRVSAKYRLPVPIALEIGVGTGVVGGTGLHVDANLSYEHDLGPVQLSVGAGYRHYTHHYDPKSLDELDSDAHQGVHGVLAVSRRLGFLPLDIFAEFVPGYDLRQSESCTFMSGVSTVCPHQADSRRYFNMGVGARYWIKM